MNARAEEFSLIDSVAPSDPKAFYALPHEPCPIDRMLETGLYEINRYDEVRAMLRNTETLSTAPLAGVGGNGDRYRVHAEVASDAPTIRPPRLW